MSRIEIHQLSTPLRSNPKETCHLGLRYHTTYACGEQMSLDDAL